MQTTVLRFSTDMLHEVLAEEDCVIIALIKGHVRLRTHG